MRAVSNGSSPMSDSRPHPRGQPFAKGNAGRPAGSKNKSTIIAQALINGDAEELLRKGLELAKSGDPTMLKFFLERYVPRDRLINFTLPKLETVEDGANALAAILRAVSEGQISPSEGAQLSKLVEGFVRTLDSVGLSRRIEAVEAELGIGGDLQRATSARVARLERKMEEFRATNGSEPRRSSKKQLAVLAALVKYGDPQPDEPLEDALKRAERALSNLDSAPLEHIHFKRESWSLEEQQWCQGVIDTTPRWLLKFADVAQSAKHLKLQMPADVEDQIPGRAAFSKPSRWPYLPRGAFFEGGQMTPEEYDAALAATDDSETDEGMDEAARTARRDGRRHVPHQYTNHQVDLFDERVEAEPQRDHGEDD
jgi:hypothetical protein